MSVGSSEETKSGLKWIKARREFMSSRNNCSIKRAQRQRANKDGNRRSSVVQHRSVVNKQINTKTLIGSNRWQSRCTFESISKFHNYSFDVKALEGRKAFADLMCILCIEEKASKKKNE